MAITASNVIADKNLAIHAGQDLNIAAGQAQASHDSQLSQSKRGLFSSGNFGLTLGRQQISRQLEQADTAAVASTVGSIAGNVELTAGTAYRQTGSDVTAPAGDITITAREVQISEARERSTLYSAQQFKQSGLTAAVSSPVLNAAQAVVNVTESAGRAGDGRTQALAAATVALAGRNAYDAVSKNPTQAGGVNLSITLGVSQSQSTSEHQADHARGSTIAAGGDLDIKAEGAGRGSPLLIRGSDLSAGGNVNLQATGDITLEAATNTASLRGSNKSSSGAVGVGVNYGSSGASIGITASASAGRGNEKGDDQSYTATHVNAGQTLNLHSSGDATVRGAVLAGQNVTAEVGGNLTIESLQDASTYAARQQSLGGSVTFGAGFSASVNANQGKSDSRYLSAAEQAGIKTGDGGFDVNVAGHTQLTGGVISSSASAAEAGLNRLSTGTLGFSDLHNSASFRASSIGIGLGYSSGDQSVGKNADGSAASGADQVPGTQLPRNDGGFSATPPLALSASGQAASTTASGISQASIAITNEAAQRTRSGQSASETLAALRTHVVTESDGARALQRIFDAQKVQEQFSVAQAFVNEAGTFVQNRVTEADALRQAAKEYVFTGAPA